MKLESKSKTAKFATTLYALIDTANEDLFDWSGKENISKSQNVSKQTPPQNFVQHDGVYQDNKDRIWIPEVDGDIKFRILVAAHAGAAGHRAYSAVPTAVCNNFYWDTIQEDCKSFCNSRIHCIATKVYVTSKWNHEK